MVGSPSIWRRPICPRKADASICPSRSGFWAPRGRSRRRRSEHYEFIGELALSGDLRPVQGVLPIAVAARDAGRELILPTENAAEAALVSGLALRPAGHLLEVCEHLNGTSPLPAYLAATPIQLSPIIQIWLRCAVRSRRSGRWRWLRRARTACC